MATSDTTTSKPKRKLTWLITGCSSGFGLSLTRIVQAGGDIVIATSRNPSRSPELVSEIESKGGKWLSLDVSSRDSQQFVDELQKSGHEIDVLVNNAGYSLFAPVENSSEEAIRAEMETMYFGPLRLIRAVLPYMRKRKFGTIVNFSSGAALDGSPSMGTYAGAKAGLDGTWTDTYLDLPHKQRNPIAMRDSFFFMHLANSNPSIAIAVTKILSKELAPFNIRTLTVVLGTFNTNMGSAAVFSELPLPEEYQGTLVDQIIGFIKAGKVPVHGDKDKAMQVVYEVVRGEGRGAGRETEKFLPLGSDMTARVKGLQESLGHALEVFGHVTDHVDVEKGT